MANPIQLKRQPPPIEVSDQGLNRRDQRAYDANITSNYGNPAHILERKIEHLAKMLDCTEEEATQLFLHNL